MQYQKNPNGEDSVYTVQGIFDSQEKAIMVCKTDQYIVFPMTMNEALPDEWFDNDEGFFPLATS